MSPRPIQSLFALIVRTTHSFFVAASLFRPPKLTFIFRRTTTRHRTMKSPNVVRPLLIILFICIVCSPTVSTGPTKRFVSSDANWGFRCDYPGNDLSSFQVSGEDCSGKCSQFSACTHFAWTTYNGGTCWLKKGPVRNPVIVDDPQAVCGTKRTGSSEDKGPVNIEVAIFH